MKKAILTLAAAILILLPAKSAFALTAEELAGVYQGTSVATLANGATVSANLTITFKPKGNIKTVVVVNGQTSAGKGKYVFVSDDAILGNFPSGEFVAFVDLNGQSLVFTLLAKQPDGSVVSERTTLVKKS